MRKAQLKEGTPDTGGLRAFSRTTDRELTPFFTGRNEVISAIEHRLDAIMRAFKAGKSPAPADGSTQLIQGAPGAGKTSLLRFMAGKWSEEGGSSPVPVAVQHFGLNRNDLVMAVAEAVIPKADKLAERRRRSAGGEFDAKVARGHFTREAVAPAPLTQGWRALRDAFKGAERPACIMVDEVQAARAPDVFSLLHELHMGLHGLPILPVLAGLAHTKQALVDNGMSRLADEAAHTLGALPQADAQESVRKFLSAFHVKGGENEPDVWTSAIAADSQGWPQHLHVGLKVAAQGAGERAAQRARRTWRSLNKGRNACKPTAVTSTGVSTRAANCQPICPNRALAKGEPDNGQVAKLHLPAQHPYNAPWIFGFLGRRALAGIEVVQGLNYRRRLHNTDGPPLWVEAQWRGHGLDVRIPVSSGMRLGERVMRIRRLFDLDANPHAIDCHLAADPTLAPWVRAAPGLRVPGAWDGFETAVRAVLGQQVSVARATDLAARLVQRFGEGSFPAPEALENADVAAIGLPGKRGGAIRALARAAAGGLLLDDSLDGRTMRQTLSQLPGIGPWTAAYISLRVGRDPNAFLAQDWVVRKMLNATTAAAEKRAVPWAPWRGYALMLIWWAAAKAKSSQL